MVKNLLVTILSLVLLASCSSLKSLNFTNSKPANAEPVKEPTHTPIKDTKFIEEITIDPQNAVVVSEPKKETKEPKERKETVVNNNLPVKETIPVKEETKFNPAQAANRDGLESISPVQLKYAVLLNTEVEMLPSKELLETVDNWYGVRYRKGGNTKTGVDCSGFSLAVYASVYGITLPRISRDQYRITRHISTTELQEGDLLFFDTKGRGSISHVGVYLGNNKFIHASLSRGVMVSGMLEPYYLQRFVGAGRVDNKSIVGSK